MYADMKFKKVGSILVSCGDQGELREQLLEDWLKLLEDSTTGQLSCAMGTLKLTSVQRKRCADTAAKLNIKSAVITDDRLGRGIVTAVGWLGAGIRAFAWKDMAKGIAYLGVSDLNEQKRLEEVAWDLRGQILRR